MSINMSLLVKYNNSIAVIANGVQVRYCGSTAQALKENPCEGFLFHLFSSTFAGLSFYFTPEDLRHNCFLHHSFASPEPEGAQAK